MKPSIGQIVIYSHPGPAYGGAGRGFKAPAIVLAVAPDDSLTLHVFSKHSSDELRGVKQGDESGEWNWPPRPPQPDTPPQESAAVPEPPETAEVKA